MIPCRQTIENRERLSDSPISTTIPTIRFDRSHQPAFDQVRPRELRRAIAAAARDRSLTVRQRVSQLQALGERQVLAPEAVFFLVARLVFRREARLESLGRGRDSAESRDRRAVEVLKGVGEPLMAELYQHRREIFDRVLEAGRRSLRKTLR